MSIRSELHIGRILALASVVAVCMTGRSFCEEGALPEEILSAAEVAEREEARKREAPPRLSVEPRLLEARVEEGDSVVREVVVANAGGSVLAFSARPSAAWLSAEPASGELGYGESCVVRITMSAPDSVGRVLGSVRLTGAGVEDTQEMSVGVALDVSEAPDRPIESTDEDTAIDMAPELDELAEAAADAGDGAPAAPAPDRSTRLGVRAGYSQFTSGDRGAVEPNALLGLGVGRERAGRRLSWEVGLDLANAEAGDGAYASSILIGRADVVIALEPARDGAWIYLVSGLDAVYEAGEESGTEYQNYATALNLGVGVRLSSGRLDLRATYGMLFETENSPGLMVVTAGYVF